MNNIRHSSEQLRWGTNPAVIEIATAVIKPFRMSEPAIDVDPFSEPEFNEYVRAARILTGAKGLDGFRDRWIDHELFPRADHVLAGFASANQSPPVGFGPYGVLANPPGDDLGDNVKNAWRILVHLWRLRWIESAVWVGFNLNQLQTLQIQGTLSPLDEEFTFRRCIPRRRLDFVAHSSRPATRIDKHGKEVENDDQPSHPSFFMLLPSRDPVVGAEQLRLFDSMSSELGAVF